MSKLRIRNGPYSGREKSLAGEPVSIGRDAEAGIQILDRSASRFHAEVFPVGGMFFVRDLESKNGTYVNDERLTDEELLREADVIKIGTTELVFESGIALHDTDSADRISYHEDDSMLSHTLEFKLDDLTDIEDEAGEAGDESRSLQILYQVGKLLAQHDNAPAPQVLDFLLRAMPAEAALIFTREADSGRLTPHTVRTVTPNDNPVICRTIIRRTVAENRAFFTADAQSDQRFNRKESVIEQGIRSVVCVPLTIAGQNRGVLYVSRSVSSQAFDRSDMEVLSACAIQLGLSFDAQHYAERYQQELWNLLCRLVHGVEGGRQQAGLGERTAMSVVALARRVRIPEANLWQLRLAALLHHVDDLFGKPGREAALAEFDNVHIVEDALPYIRTSEERLDGTGPYGFTGEELDVGQRSLALAVAFVRAQRDRPEADALEIIDDLAKDPGYDEDLCAELKACHLDGSLYQEPFARID